MPGLAGRGLRLAIAVNLSARNLLDAEFPTQVAELLERWNVEPALLEFEITESAMLADPMRTKLILERLAAWASGSPSTTSAPDTPRWPTSSACPSARSRSTGRSS